MIQARLELYIPVTSNRHSSQAHTIRHLMQIPGVPVMYLQSHRYTIERLPEATMGGAPRV